MLQYQRYLFKHVIFILGITLLGLAAILWLMQTLRLVDFIVNQGIPIGLFLKLSGLLLPSMIMLSMPVAVSVAVVFLYHRLRMDSELVVLQSAGLSRFQLALPAVYAAVLASVCAMIISFFILPITTREFRDMQFFLRNNYVSVLLQEGVFSTPVNGLTVYVRERAGDKSFRGIMVHDSRDPSAPITMMAEKADLQATSQGPEFVLYHGNRQEMRGGGLSFLQFDRYVLDISVYTRGIEGRKQDSEEQSVANLLSTPPEDFADSSDYLQARADGHQRIIWPLLPFVLTVMVVGMMLSGEFNRRHRWQHNAMAAGAVVMVVVAMVAMRGMISRYSIAVPFAYLLLLLPLAGGLFALWPRTMTLRQPAEPEAL